MLLPWATLIYIDLGTYNSLVRSNSSHSAKEFGAQNSRGDLLNERKRLKDRIRFFFMWVLLDKYFQLTAMADEY